MNSSTHCLRAAGFGAAFGAKVVLVDIDLMLPRGSVTALLGPSGAGKSTLFSLILKEDTPDAGTVQRDEYTTLGFLPQESEALGNETALEVATGRAGDLDALETVLRKHEQAGSTDDPEYFEAQTKFDVLHNPESEAKAK